MMKTTATTLAILMAISFSFAEKENYKKVVESMNYINSKEFREHLKKENNMTEKEKEQRWKEAREYAKGCYAVCENSKIELYHSGKKIDGISNCFADKESSKKISKAIEECK